MFEKLVINYAPRFAAWILIVLGLCLLSTCVTGCQTSEQLVKNLNKKNIQGDVVIIKNEATTTDPTTGCPTFSSMVAIGELSSVVKGSNLIRYTRKVTPSWYNKDNVTVVDSLTISLGDNGNMADTIKQAHNLLSLYQSMFPTQANPPSTSK